MGYSKYPGQIDTSTELPVTTDLVTGVIAEVVNRLRNAVLAIENELGTNPSSTYRTVKARLDAMWVIINTFDGRYIRRDGSTPFEGSQSMGNFRLTNVKRAIADGQALAYGQAGANLQDLDIDNGDLDVSGPGGFNFTATDIDLDPTGNVTLDMDAGNVVTVTISDNLASSLIIQDAAGDDYINVDTAIGVEGLSLCNATNNAFLTQLGAGQVTFNGNVDCDAGCDVDGGDLSVAAGAANDFDFNGANIDLDPTAAYTLDMDAAQNYTVTMGVGGTWLVTGGGGADPNSTVEFSIGDNIADVFSIYEGLNDYLKITTTNAAEEIEIGNTVANVTVNVLDNDGYAFTVQEATNSYIAVNTTNGAESIELGNTVTDPDIIQRGIGNVTFNGTVAINNRDLWINGGDIEFYNNAGVRTGNINAENPYLELNDSGYIQLGLDPTSGAGSAAATGGIRLQGNGAVQGRIVARNIADTDDVAMMHMDNSDGLNIGGLYPVRPTDLIIDSVAGVTMRRNGITKMVVGNTAASLYMQDLNWHPTLAVDPQIYQIDDNTAAATGDLFLIHAQDMTGGGGTTGGDLHLRPGSGDTQGELELQDGYGTPQLLVTDFGLGYANFEAINGYARFGDEAGIGEPLPAADSGDIRMQALGTIISRNDTDADDVAMMSRQVGNNVYIGGPYPVRPSNIYLDGQSSLTQRIAGGTILYITSASVRFYAPLLQFDPGTASPIFYQVNGSVAGDTGETMLIHAQDEIGGGGTTGGDLHLRPGSGDTQGELELQDASGTAVITVNDTGSEYDSDMTMMGNYEFKPDNDLDGYVGTAAKRFWLVRAKNITSGDLSFDDEYCPNCGLPFEVGDDLVLSVKCVGKDEAGHTLTTTVPAHSVCPIYDENFEEECRIIREEENEENYRND